MDNSIIPYPANTAVNFGNFNDLFVYPAFNTVNFCRYAQLSN
jgi:hypothetical protein